MFRLQLNECVHSETCLDEGFSQHIPTHVSLESYDWMIKHLKAEFDDRLFLLTCSPHLR